MLSTLVSQSEFDTLDHNHCAGLLSVNQGFFVSGAAPEAFATC